MQSLQEAALFPCIVCAVLKDYDDDPTGAAEQKRLQLLPDDCEALYEDAEGMCSTSQKQETRQMVLRALWQTLPTDTSATVNPIAQARPSRLRERRCLTHPHHTTPHTRHHNHHHHRRQQTQNKATPTPTAPTTPTTTQPNPTPFHYAAGRSALQPAGLPRSGTVRALPRERFDAFLRSVSGRVERRSDDSWIASRVRMHPSHPNPAPALPFVQPISPIPVPSHPHPHLHPIPSP